MFSEKMLQLGQVRSVIRDMFEYGNKRAAQIGRENVFDFSLGNPSVPAPEEVNAALINLLQNENSVSLHGYTSAAGDPNVRGSIADYLNNQFGTDYSPANIYLTVGAAAALTISIKALVEENDEIIVFAPFFPEYRVFIETTGAKCVIVKCDEKDFQIDFDALNSAITKNTKAVIINSPCNPSGVVFSEDTIIKLSETLKNASKRIGREIFVIADEPYRELVYDDIKVPFIPNIYKNTIVCYSWSKSLSLPGERIGYFLVPDACDDAKEVYLAISGAARINGHVCAPTLAQMVIERCVSEMPDLQAYDDNRTLLYESLTAMGYRCAKPDGAFYLFVEVPGGDDFGFCEKAKNEHNLLVVPGTGFDCPGFMRLSYCVSNAMIKRSLPAFEKMIADLK